MSGATDCQLETAIKQAPKRKTLHFFGLTGSHFKSRCWGGTSVISVLLARFGAIPGRLDSARGLAPEVRSRGVNTSYKVVQTRVS
jgi:hypothetical protein